MARRSGDSRHCEISQGPEIGRRSGPRLGRCYELDGRLDDSKVSWEKATNRTKRDALGRAQAFLGLAQVAHRLGEEDEANRAIEAARAALPGWPKTEKVAKSVGFSDR